MSTKYLAGMLLWLLVGVSASAQTLSFHTNSLTYNGNPNQLGTDLSMRYGNTLSIFDGTSFNNLAIPANYSGWSFWGSSVFNGNLYMQYLTNPPGFHMMEYDGTNLTEQTTPAGYINNGWTNIYTGYQAEAHEYNGNLYAPYNQINGNRDLFSFDGTTLDSIPSPAGYDGGNNAGYQGDAFEFNGNLYLRYTANSGTDVLFKYDGTTLTELPAPAGFGSYFADPVAYNGKLYLRYIDNSLNFALVEFDGTTLTPIANPVGYENGNYGYEGDPLVHNGKLYLRFQGNDQNFDLMEFDGTTFTPIPSPSSHDFPLKGYFGSPFEYNGSLWLRYRSNGDAVELANYDGAALTILPNPTGYTSIPAGLEDQAPIEYFGKMYLKFQHNSGRQDVVEFDGSSYTTVASPAGYDNSGSGYEDSPIVVGNNLYFRYKNNNGSYDLAQLTVCIPTTDSLSATECSSYTVPSGNATYTTVGTYTVMDTIPNSCAGDSMLTITLTILPQLTSSYSDTICFGDSIVVGGITFNASNPTGSAVFTGIGPNSCDSTVAVSLTILPALTSTQTDTVCFGDSIVVGGITFNANNPTGTAVFSGIGPNNCDSTVMVSLTILPALTSTQTDTVCFGDSIVVAGTTFNAGNPSGTVVFSSSSPNGCDSLVTVNVMVLPEVTSVLNATVCHGDSIEVNGTTYHAGNPTGTEVFQNTGAFGCDSTVTVHLTELPALASNFSPQVCTSDSVVVNGTTYNANNLSGVEVFTGIGTYGCDSTVTVNISIVSVLTSTFTGPLCVGDSVVINTTVYNAANPTGTETFLGGGAGGCDSVVTVDLAFLPAIDATTTTSNATITANQTGGTYQWIDCDNGNAPIANETSQSFTATANGNYAVMITQNGCSTTSECVQITGVNVHELASALPMQLFPNPTSGRITIALEGAYQLNRVVVWSLVGQKVQEHTINATSRFQLNLAGTPGIYIVEVWANGVPQRQRVVVR